MNLVSDAYKINGLNTQKYQCHEVGVMIVSETLLIALLRTIDLISDYFQFYEKKHFAFDREL